MVNAIKRMGLGIELESFCKSQSWGCWLRKRAWVGGNLWWIEDIGHTYLFWAIYAVGIGDKSFNKTDSPWIYWLIFFKRIYLPSRVEWIKNMWYICTYIYTHTHWVVSIKENEILPFATTWMDLEGIMLTEISQTEKYKYYMISLICGIQKIQQTSEYYGRRQWHPTPVLWPGKSHGRRSLVGCSPWGR